MKETIRVWVKEPGKAPERRGIPNELKALQEAVGGYIETVTLGPDLVVICNEEGRLIGLPFNCRVFNMPFYGPIVIAGIDAGIDGDEFDDTPEEYVDLMLNRGGMLEW